MAQRETLGAGAGALLARVRARAGPGRERAYKSDWRNCVARSRGPYTNATAGALQVGEGVGLASATVFQDSDYPDNGGDGPLMQLLQQSRIEALEPAFAPRANVSQEVTLSVRLTEDAWCPLDYATFRKLRSSLVY